MGDQTHETPGIAARGFDRPDYTSTNVQVHSTATVRLSDPLALIREAADNAEPPPPIEPAAPAFTGSDLEAFAAALGCVKCGEPTEHRSGTGHPVCDSCASVPVEVYDWTDDYGERRLRLRPASTIRHVRKRWVWDKRIPTGTLTLLAGDGGVGKSTLTAEVVAKISGGELPGEHHGTPRVVWWLTAEEDAGTVRSRLHAAGADLEFVKVVTVQIEGQGDAPIVIPGDLELLRQAVDDDHPVLMVLDAFNDFLVGTIDSHKDHSLRQALTPLTMFAEESDVAIWALMHLNKGAGLSGGSRLMGSAGYRNKARSLFLFGKEPDSPALYLIHDKANYGPQQVTLEYRLVSVALTDDNGEPEDIGRVEYVGEAEHVGARDVLGVPVADDDAGSVDSSLWLLHRLADGRESWRAIELAAATDIGLTSKQMRTVRDKLKKQGLVDFDKPDFHSGWFWILTPAGQDALSKLPNLPVPETGQLGQVRELRPPRDADQIGDAS